MRKPEVLLTFALLGSAALSYWLWGELQDERMRNAELSARVSLLTTPISAQETVTPSLPAAPVATVVAASTSNITTAPSPPTEFNARKDAVESQRLMLQEPKYREAWRAQMRLNFARRRENVMRLLGFTPEEADAVIEIAIDRQLSWIERLRPETRTLELGEQQRALYLQDKRDDDAKLLGLLGDQKFSRLQEYMESRNTRVHVDQLRPLFTGEDTIREDQVEPLIAALHVEHTRLRTEQQEYRRARSDDPSPGQQPDREIELLEAAHARMHTAAAPILSDSQLKRFDTLLKRDFERQQLEMRMSGNTPNADESDAD